MQDHRIKDMKKAVELFSGRKRVSRKMTEEEKKLWYSVVVNRKK